MRRLETTVRELLAAAQAERKAKLDAGRVDTVFKVGDRVLLRTKELLDAADIGKLRPRWRRWDGPVTVTACPSPSAYTLSLPSKMRCSPAVNVDRLKPFFARTGAPPPRGAVSDAGQEGEHEVELLLDFKTVRGVTRCLVRWRGHTSADGSWLRLGELAHSWLRLGELAHCAEKVAQQTLLLPAAAPHAVPATPHRIRRLPCPPPPPRFLSRRLSWP